MHLSKEQVTESGTNIYTVEASDLGLPPGRWPVSMTTDLGNGNSLWYQGFTPDGGARYRQHFNDLEVWVLND